MSIKQEYLEQFPELDSPSLHFIEYGKKADHLIGRFGWSVNRERLTMVTGWNEKAELVEFDGRIGAWVLTYGISTDPEIFIDITDLTSHQAWRLIREAYPSRKKYGWMKYSQFRNQLKEFLHS